MTVNRNGQYEVDGLLLGRGTNYLVDTVLGLGGVPETKTADRDRQGFDGGYADVDYLAPREIIMAVGIDGVPEHSTFDTLITDLGEVFAPRAADVAFRYQRFGRIRRILARPRGLILPWDSDFHLGAGRATARLVANDPLSYADDVSSVGPSTGTFPVTNSGNYPVWPTITTAAGGSITMTNVTTGQSVVVDGLAGAAVIDFGARTVEVGGVDAYEHVAVNPAWWRLQPGLNSVTLSASGTITFRHGWTTG